MNITYTPEVCKTEESDFKGEVVLRAPAYEELLEVVSGNPELLEDAEASNASLNMKKLMHLVKWSYQFYVKVDITRKSDGKKYASLDDLRYDMKAAPVLQDVAIRLSKGIDLGNP